MKTRLHVRIILLVLCMLFAGTAAPFPGAAAEPSAGEPAAWPEAVQREAKNVWETVCAKYGRVSIETYNGEWFIGEGSGAALPLLCRADGDYFLVILVQQEDTLIQIIYRIDEDGSSQQVFMDQVLTLDRRQAFFFWKQSGSALISAVSLEDDMAAYAAAVPHTVEKRMFQGNEDAESIAEMGIVPWEAFAVLYGDPEWDVRVDANYGLFHLQIRDPRDIQEIFGVEIP